MGDKTKEQLLEELSEMQKMLEERTTETQGQMIRKVQMFIANEGLFSQVIDFFPYPIAIFTSEYNLALVNKAFKAETKTLTMNPEREAVRILQYNINDMHLATAVTQVFAGDTFFLENLKNPFSMFSGIKESDLQPDRFHKAVIFPVPADNAGTIYGVILFMP